MTDNAKIRKMTKIQKTPVPPVDAQFDPMPMPIGFTVLAGGERHHLIGLPPTLKARVAGYVWPARLEGAWLAIGPRSDLTLLYGAGAGGPVRRLSQAIPQVVIPGTVPPSATVEVPLSAAPPDPEPVADVAREAAKAAVLALVAEGQVVDGERRPSTKADLMVVVAGAAAEVGVSADRLYRALTSELVAEGAIEYDTSARAWTRVRPPDPFEGR